MVLVEACFAEVGLVEVVLVEVGLVEVVLAEVGLVGALSGLLAAFVDVNLETSAADFDCQSNSDLVPESSVVALAAAGVLQSTPFLLLLAFAPS